MPTMPKPDRVKAPGKPHQVRRPGATPRSIEGDTREKRNARLYRRSPLCVMCLAQGKLTEVQEWDHVTPLSQGGRDHESNLQGLCKACHRAKTAAERAGSHRRGT